MSDFKSKSMLGVPLRWLAAASIIMVNSFAQTGGGAASGGAAAGPKTYNSVYHVGFDRPEAWALKYFASMSLLSGLPQPEPVEGYKVGTVTLGLEAGWLPTLDAGQMRVGFNGTAPEDLNKAPILVRPVVRVKLPGQFSAVVAMPPPFELFGITPHLFAFGVERPIVQRERWTLGWRGYGQVGSVKGAFTCPRSVLSFAPGSSGNPTACVGESADVASLRYVGSEFQISYRFPRRPKFIPHAAAGGNFIDGVFQVDSPVQGAHDQTRLWTRGGTFSGTAGITYLVTKRIVFTVDAFYSPLFVQRTPGAAPTNDGLFNVRALMSYTFQ